MCVVSPRGEGEVLGANSISSEDEMLELVRTSMAEELESINSLAARRFAVASEEVKEALGEVLTYKKLALLGLFNLMVSLDHDMQHLIGEEHDHAGEDHDREG